MEDRPEKAPSDPEADIRPGSRLHAQAGLLRASARPIFRAAQARAPHPHPSRYTRFATAPTCSAPRVCAAHFFVRPSDRPLYPTRFLFDPRLMVLLVGLGRFKGY